MEHRCAGHGRTPSGRQHCGQCRPDFPAHL